MRFHERFLGPDGFDFEFPGMIGSPQGSRPLNKRRAGRGAACLQSLTRSSGIDGESLGWPVLVLGDSRGTPLNAGGALPGADRKAHFPTSRGSRVKRLKSALVRLEQDLGKQLAQRLT